MVRWVIVMADDKDWLAKELHKSRQGHRLIYIGATVGLCLIIGVSALIYYSTKHNTPVKLANSSAITHSTNTIPITGSNTTSTSPTISTGTTTTQPTPQLPTTLTGSDQAEVTNTITDSNVFAADIEGSKTDVLYQDQVNVSDDLTAVKAMDLNKYALATGTDIVTITSELTTAYNQYTQAYSDTFAIANLDTEIAAYAGNATQQAIYQTQETNDASQKQTDISSGDSSVRSAQALLVSIE